MDTNTQLQARPIEQSMQDDDCNNQQSDLTGNVESTASKRAKLDVSEEQQERATASLSASNTDQPINNATIVVVSPDTSEKSSTSLSRRRSKRIRDSSSSSELPSDSTDDASAPGKLSSLSLLSPQQVTSQSTNMQSDAIDPTKDSSAATPASPRKKERNLRKAPSDWQEIYSLVEELRQDRTAPCDHSGCEALPLRDNPRAFRFQVLMSLILSSQTKDATVGAAIRKMQADGVLNVESIAKMDYSELNAYINKVGFHNNKTKYIMQVVQILRDKYDGDIPLTAAEMMDLPGVGPKMAYICENVSWERQSGIGVDTHMHRLFNELGWVESKNPEQTRVQLEDWLPRDKWGSVNLLWVGFGQEVQQFKPKILRKALDCSQPVAALKLLKRCGLDYAKEGKKLGMEDEISALLKGSKESSEPM
jgi:endonuclease III